MNYSKLKTENMCKLVVKSMRKVHTITHLSFNETGHNKLYSSKDLIGVAHFECDKNTTTLAVQYSGDRVTQLECKSTSKASYTGFYMQTHDGNYYQIAGIFTDIDEANEFMANREDTGLIDSTNIKGLEKQYHFIASLEESKATKRN